MSNRRRHTSTDTPSLFAEGLEPPNAVAPIALEPATVLRQTQPRQSEPAPRSGPLACLYIEDLPSWAVKRRCPRVQGLAVIVVSGQRVIGANRAATGAGVRIGDAQSRARALLPGAEFYRDQRDAVLSTWRAALEVCNTFTPWLEAQRPGLVWLAGLNAVEARRLAAQLGVRVGLAGSRDAAHLAALSAAEGSARVSSDDRSLLESLPIASLLGLGFQARVVQRLELLGFPSVGAVARLGVEHLSAQFGKSVGAALQRVTAGLDRRSVAVFEPPSVVSARIEFDEAGSSGLGSALRMVAERAVQRLRGLQAAWVGVTVEGRTRSSLRRFLPVSSADPRQIERVALALLERITGLELGDGQPLEVGALTVTLGELSRPALTQDSLFALLERPKLREAIRRVHGRHPGLIGRLEQHRPRAMLPEQRSRFVALTGDEAVARRAKGGG